MRRSCAFSLIVIVTLSVIPFITIPRVEASEGEAMVYIVCLPGVDGWTYTSGAYDPSDTRDGAIEATLFREKLNLPLAHPKFGKSIPFYKSTYTVVTSWSTYKTIIETYEEVVIVNTHGEITPIPSGYNRGGWTDEIAEAMLERRITWVHTSGYPFKYNWNQGGSTKQLWGDAGFQRLMSAINMPTVTCDNPYPIDQKVELTLDAGDNLRPEGVGGWDDVGKAYKAEHGKPLKASDFAEYLVMPIWGTNYYSGAIITFVKPSERLNVELRNFGCYIHIGTRKTFTSDNTETNGDFWRGFVGVATALLLETSPFGTEGANGVIDYGFPTQTEYGIAVTPVLSSYDREGATSTFHVRLFFGIYGGIKTNHNDEIGEVLFYLGNIPEGCTVEMKPLYSRNGYDEGEDKLVGTDWEPAKVYASALLFIITMAEVNPYVAAVAAGLEGLMIFSDWLDLSNDITWADKGVDEAESEVQFRYNPNVECSEPGDGYHYEEFESLIYIELNVPLTSMEQWKIIPLEWEVILDKASPPYYDEIAKGDVSVAIFNDYDKNDYKAHVYFDDFSEGLSDWTRGDSDAGAGSDYWGVSRIDAGYEAWCAAVGYNSVKGGTNLEKKQYDKQMNAHLTKLVDQRFYESVRLNYTLWWHFADPGDYMKVESYSGGWSSLGSTYTGDDWGYRHHSRLLPASASKFRFRFRSDSDSNVMWGVFLSSVGLIAEMPNDANSGDDAGDTFSGALNIGISSSITTHAGYLNEDEDWYKFYISSGDVSHGKIIEARLNTAINPNSEFRLELYNPSNERVAGPSTSIEYQLSTGDSQGNWRLRLFAIKGFAHYSFDLWMVQGGCPYIYTWDGSEYILDNNVLGMSEASNGSDVEDFYRFEQRVTPYYHCTYFSVYSFVLGEFENEHSSIDNVRLYAVDHDPNTNIAVTSNGGILTYSDPNPPISVIDNYGYDCLSLLAEIDDTYYLSFPNDHLLIDFGTCDVSQASKLVLRANIEWKKALCIHVQTLNQAGGWEDASILRTRNNWSTIIVDLNGYLPNPDGTLKIRLYFDGVHKIDYVGLDTTPQAEITTRITKAVRATHSIHGDVTFRLLFDDERYAELLPSEQIELKFILLNTEKTRTFIIYIEGHYETIE